MIHDMSDAFALIGEQTITVKRRAAATYDTNGRAVDGALTTLSVSAVLVPVSAKERSLLPEGIRDREMVAVFSATELRTDDAPSGVAADVVVWQGKDYVVHAVERWTEAGGYVKALATRLDA